MKIVKVELRELNGTLKTEKPFWEERLVRQQRARSPQLDKIFF